MLLSTLSLLQAVALSTLLADPALGVTIYGEKKPIRLGNCARENATVNLYPKNPTNHPQYYYNPNVEDTRPYNTLSIPPNVCLSGDYPLSRNLEIVNAPICADGKTATWSTFRERRCSGQPVRGAFMSSISSWPEAPYYWSLIFRCNAQLYTPIFGDVEHINAMPPIGPTKGIIQQGGLYTCAGIQGLDNMLTRKQSLAVDTCHTTRDYGLRIDQVATCKNGTRAQWARFSDDKCKTPMAEDPLMDINDNDLYQCQALGDWRFRRPDGGPSNSWKVGSMSFHCDGVQEPEEGNPQAQPAAISTDSCRDGTVTPYSPPTFSYPEPDTCVNHYGLRLNIYENAICPNGTSAIFAQYKYSGCLNKPMCTAEIGNETLGQCIATDTFQSFSFMCTGTIQRPMQPPSWRPGFDRGREKKATAILIAGIVMLTVGILLLMAVILRSIFKDEKRRARVKSMFIFRRRQGTIVLL